ATGRVDEVDHRCDQWALACAAWRMITGTRPFAGATLTEFLQQVVTVDPPPMASLIPDAVPEVEFVLRRALAKKQDDRYPTIAAFARAFQTAAARAGNDAPVATPSPRPVLLASPPTPVAAAPTARPVAAPAPSATAAAPSLASAKPERRAPTAVLAVVTLMSLVIGGVLFYRAGGPALLRSQYERATGQAAPAAAPTSGKRTKRTAKTEAASTAR
ncbi:MAG TPA: hypothetical protein VGF45_15360, partial [Polyangia bacterium]